MTDNRTRRETCPECGSERIRLMWAAVDTDDFDSLACLDCDHRWVE